MITLVIGHIKTYLKYTRGLLNDYRVHAYQFALSGTRVRPCHIAPLIYHKAVFDISLAFENHSFLISCHILKPHDWYLEVTLIILLEIEICQAIECCIQRLFRYWHFISFNQRHSTYYSYLRWYWFMLGQRNHWRWIQCVGKSIMPRCCWILKDYNKIQALHICWISILILLWRTTKNWLLLSTNLNS